MKWILMDWRMRNEDGKEEEEGEEVEEEEGKEVVVAEEGP